MEKIEEERERIRIKKVVKSGRVKALVLTDDILDELELSIGDYVIISVREGKLVIEKLGI